ncbi:MAG: hypothetical protein CMI02_00865 [Oceanospirillaceae bacterium]|nr:hypothetical protein [Oceanospirillaceae bacterium]MBT10570.1 hypothetical protein [Oceanospirillaceae bacterium]|tara:strand:- start:110454 stop:110690 length:237 start_codon:yes stop_codon:yes gene_type:complete
MKCCFCGKSALKGGTPTTVPGTGIAHQECYKKHLIDERVFKTLNLRHLQDSELSELSDLVQMEKNARNPAAGEIDLWD